MTKGAKILITGGNGFIARNLAEQLGDECLVTTCNSSELNLLDTNQVFQYLKSNSFNLVRCQDYYDKMLYFGSGAEFDRTNWQPKMKEDYFDRHVPVDQYGLSKYIMTKYTQMSKKIINLRVFSVFGKYEDWRYRFISKACCCAIFDLPIVIRKNVYFDYLYVDDFVRIVKWFVDNNPKKQVYNVCSGQSVDYKTIAEQVVEISGKKLDIVVEAEGLNPEYSGENSLLLSEVGRVKMRSLDESIKDLYNWYESVKSTLDRKELSK